MTTKGTTDFDRIFTPRKEKAIKAISLLENGAAKRYEATREDALAMISEIQESLDVVKAAYGLTSNMSDGMDDNQIATMINPPAAPSDNPDTASNGRHTAGSTISSMGSHPYYANIGEFVAGIPEKDMPNYVTHLTHRIYEDLAELSTIATKEKFNGKIM